MESKTLSSVADDRNKTVSSVTNNQQIKGGIKGKTPSSVINNQQVKGGDLESKTLSFNVRQGNGQPQHSLHQSHRSPSTGSPRKLNAQEVGVAQAHPQGLVKNKPQVVNEAISTGATAYRGSSRSATPSTGAVAEQTRATKERKLVPDASQDHITTEAKDGQVLRQRSTDSFTLSSSPSEGETPNSSEGTSHSEDQSQRTQKGSSFKDSGLSKPGLSLGKSKKSSKKQSKKSKKKGKGQGGQSSSLTAAEQQAKSKKISKRRAYVLERIRSDSLTSSDEEHCLGSSEMSTSSTDSGTSSLLLHQDSILEDGDSAVVDMDKLKCHLQRRIMAKKPPATFETPATQPIFHEVSGVCSC